MAFSVPSTRKPDYARVANDEEAQGMRLAGSLAAQTLEMIAPHVQPGVTTAQLDRICHNYITEELDSIPAPLNYRGFPKSICTSINNVVCHGIPADDVHLRRGDIINVDVTVIKDGWHGDTSVTFLVGPCAAYDERLVAVTQECLYLGIAEVAPGKTLGDVGHVIQSHATKHRYGLVREYCGHGIGRIFHDDPQVEHYGEPNTGVVLEESMTFTIEPMLNAGTGKTKLLQDGWTVKTRDGRSSAQWEHTLMVTATGCEVLTARSDENFPT